MLKKLCPSLLLFTIYYLRSSTSASAAVLLQNAFKLNNTDTVASKFPSITTLISTILPNIYIVSGLILFFLLLGGGFAVMASGGNVEQIDKGKQAISGAIIGFIIIFASFWIIQLIEKLTGIPILNTTSTPLLN